MLFNMKILSILILLLSVSTARAEWRYSTSIDKMSGKSSSSASLMSNNTESLNMGRTTKTLLFINTVDRITLYTDFGMLNCNTSFYAGSKYCSVRVKIDNKLVDWKVSQFNHGSEIDYKHITFEQARNFIHELAGAKKLIIELSYYKDSPKVFEFNIAGLDLKKI